MLHIPPDINGDLTGPGLTLSAARIFFAKRAGRNETKCAVSCHGNSTDFLFE